MYCIPHIYSAFLYMLHTRNGGGVYLDGPCYPHDIIVCFSRQSYHEVQLHLPPPLVPCSLHTPQKLFVRQTLKRRKEGRTETETQGGRGGRVLLLFSPRRGSGNDKNASSLCLSLLGGAQAIVMNANSVAFSWDRCMNGTEGK